MSYDKLIIPKYDPPGIRFLDAVTNCEMKLITSGTWKGWLVYLHCEGHWVSLRKAIPSDMSKIEAMKSKVDG